MKSENVSWWKEWNKQIKENQNAWRKGKYNYMGILEADIIKQVEMKEKFKKSISGERENYSNQIML